MFLDNKSIIGVMSGSSLDGLDIGAFKFSFDSKNWEFEINHFETFSLPEALKNKLRNSDKLTKQQIHDLDLAYGEFIGNSIKNFCNFYKINPALIGVHGHTVFHEPSKGYSLQIGDGETIAQITKTPVVNDFRNGDIKKGGQGAPLVPIGDELLFTAFDSCLNLGGISNITLRKESLAFDIYYCNRALNYLAQQLGFEYDESGNLASGGQVNQNILENLLSINYLGLKPPKSLNNQDFEKFLIPIFDKYKFEKIENLLRTYVEFLAIQIGKTLVKSQKTLVTGGGALNSFFIEVLKEKSDSEIVVPEKIFIDSKEALIFAFMAFLKWEKKVNILSCYTGAYEDSSSGKINFPS